MGTQQPAPEVPRQAAAPVTQTPSVQAPGASAAGPFAGGIPAGQASPGVLSLSLRDALARGLKQNLGLILGEQATRTAEAARLFARAGLLPDVTAQVADTGEQINLKALGFTSFPGAPGFRTIVGPFNVFDARLYATQPLVNLSALFNNRAARQGLRAAQFSYQDARDIVVLVVAGLYLQAVADRARIDAAQAQVNTAQALYQRAVDMRNAGVAAGIDVLRAQVELQAQQQRLIFFRNEFEKQKLNLARAIGLPIGQQIALSDQVPYTPAPPVTLEQALDVAYRSRSDYRSAQELVSAAENQKRAAEAERLPSLGFSGNYGAIGPRPWDSHGTFAAAFGLTVPVFQAGRVRAAVLQADAQLQQRRAQEQDLRASINYELRTAFLDLQAAGDQVQVARSAQTLANQQLTQAQDRFTAGVANNIEVVQAQEALATADENYISALFSYNLAKVSLARSVGGAEKNAMQYLGAR